MTNLRDRVKAMFLLVAIGDALGMPVETFTEEEIKEHLKKLGIDGKLKIYLRPDGHKWFNGRDAGTITDDWLFTKITIESLIRMRGFDMDDMARAHVEPYTNGTLKNFGAGKSTREALRKLNNGVHWSQSGAKGGAGNGIAMKIAPLIPCFLAEVIKVSKTPKGHAEVEETMFKAIYDYTLMTHNSGMALASAFAQIMAIDYCLSLNNKDDFNPYHFFLWIFNGAHCGELIFNDGYCKEDPKNLLSLRLFDLGKDFRAGKLNDTDYIIKKYAGTGKSTGYILNSIPFSYAFFLRNPFSIDALYDVVNAGGDTDTNAAIIGPMLGALNGTKIIPQHLLDGLKVREEVERLADEFCDVFNITD